MYVLESAECPCVLQLKLEELAKERAAAAVALRAELEAKHKVVCSRCDA